MDILYIGAFRNEYNDNVFIQRRKKAVICQFDNSNYKVDFIYNSTSKYPLTLSSGHVFYTKLLPCNVASNFLEKIHQKLFKFSNLYSLVTFKIILKRFNLNLDSYDAIIAEGWEHLAATALIVKERKIIGRIYGTGNLTERIENNFFYRINPFFNKMRHVINSNKIKGIIFNSTGSRSRDLFNLLSGNKTVPVVKPIYLDMPNLLFEPIESKERLKGGRLRLLQVARMTEGHGFNLTIKIIERLVKEHGINVEANLVGDGVCYEKNYGMVKDKKLDKYIKLTGRLGLDELLILYKKSDIVINYYGYNPIIEAINHECFIITREFGEVQRILSKFYNDKIYRVLLKEHPKLIINKSLQYRYVEDVIDQIQWYLQNCSTIQQDDFIPKKRIDVRQFSINVFNEYQEMLARSV